MNTINFLEKPNFPLSSDVLNFMQQSYLMLQKFAGFGGKRYILAGCEEVGNTIKEGFIVVDGEVIPFAEGTRQSTIIVISETRAITAFGENFNVYNSKYAHFGTGSPQYAWSDFVRIPNIQELLAKITNIQWTDINNKPATFTPAAHNQDWNTITGKPTTFPPAAHNQDWSTIDGKPQSAVYNPFLVFSGMHNGLLPPTKYYQREGYEFTQDIDIHAPVKYIFYINGNKVERKDYIVNYAMIGIGYFGVYIVDENISYIQSHPIPNISSGTNTVYFNIYKI